jgi:hypothetical protein
LRWAGAAATLMAMGVHFLMALLATAAPAFGHGGGDRDEARARGTCGAGARIALEAKADGGRIGVEAKVDHVRRASRWRVTLTQEGRVAWRGTVRAGGSSGSFRVRRGLDDLAGADRIGVRAAGPGGVTCRAAVTLAGN